MFKPMGDFSVTFRPPQSNPDVPRDMYNLAQGFYFAGGRCLLNIDTGPKQSQSLPIPSIVNYCFAIELFFKALIRTSGETPKKIHKLFELYNMVPEGVRAKIIQKASPSFTTESALLGFIEQVSDHFQQVRYHYEYPVVVFPDGQIAQLARAVYLVCSEEFATS